MPEIAKKRAVYEDLYDLPDHLTGQIIDGELVVTPRPAPRHAKAAVALSSELAPPFDFGRGGPGGWILLIEPEVRLGEHTLVPDLAGWRKERFPRPLEDNWIAVAPDWVCEILSPGTVRVDRVKKMRIYREHAVPHVWMVDPLHRSLEVFGTGQPGAWVSLGLFVEDDKVRAVPFEEAEIDLKHCWLE